MSTLEDTAPLDVVDRPEGQEQGRQLLAGLSDVAGLKELVAVSTQRVDLQQSRALRQAMTDEEVKAEIAVAAVERGVARQFAEWQAGRELRQLKWRARWSRPSAWCGRRAQAWRAWREQRAVTRDANAEANDRRWHVRAQRVRRRMTSNDAQMAAHLRSSRLWSLVLMALMGLGLLQAGLVIQDNWFPVAEPANLQFWLALFMEAMASVALIALMRSDARAAGWDTRSGWGEASAWAVKAGLVLVSLAAAAGPALMREATSRQEILQKAWGPLLVAAVLVIHDRITRRDGKILRLMQARADSERVDDLVAATLVAVDQGWMPSSQTNAEGEVAPSSSRIASTFRISKEQARMVRDQVNARAGQLVG